MELSDYGKKFIQRWEGLKLKVYLDIADVPTIGYGHTGTLTYDDYLQGKTITEIEADQLFEMDVQRFVNAVNNLVTVDINQNEFDALVSLSFNIGVRHFTESTCLRRLNSGDFKGAAEALTWWNKARQGGVLKVSRGLKNRRAQEKALFLKPEPEEPIKDIVENQPLLRRVFCNVIK